VVGDSGAVHLFAGSRTGLETQDGQVFHRDDWPDVPRNVRSDRHFR
jgi:hypothetical protein